MRSSGGRQTYAAVFAMDLRSGERFKTSSGFAVYVCASADMFGVTYYYEGDEHRKPNTLSPYALVFPLGSDGDYIYHSRYRTNNDYLYGVSLTKR